METIAVDSLDFTRCGKTDGGQQHLIVRGKIEGMRALMVLPDLTEIALDARAERILALRTEEERGEGVLERLEFVIAPAGTPQGACLTLVLIQEADASSASD